MSRIPKKMLRADHEQPQVWIRPGPALKSTPNSEGRAGHSSNSRYLELADIALGLKKSEGKKKKPLVRIRTSEKV